MDGLAARDARSMFEEGNRWMYEEEYQKAIESYQNAVTKLPAFSEGWRAKGLAEQKKGDELVRKGMESQAEPYYRSAVKSLETAHLSFPDDLQVLTALASSLQMLDRYDDSIYYLEKAEDMDPDNPDIKLRLDDSLRKTRLVSG